ncbi:MAG TPA: sce7725 family protein [Caldisericia bacterium]|nr:sce7725 family protein [Caldisericia bacterium]
MYHPYVRGKQFELILIRDNAEFLAKNQFHPIIEPVKEDLTPLSRAMIELSKYNTPCTLIVNPKVGQNPVNSKDLIEFMDESFKDFSNLSLGYILTPESKMEELIGVLQKNQKRTFSIIHYGYTNSLEISKSISCFSNISRHIFIDGYAGKLYQSHLKNEGVKRILIRDGFKTQKKNAQYPPNEHFSDLHITYEDEGMDGFGDFLIVGDDYSETGGPAYAVAIHLTYLEMDQDMNIYHFLSDQTDSPTDPGGKFLEALKKLIDTVRNPNTLIFNSSAIKDFCDLYEKSHYPGLGFVKKLSMQHHIELVADYLSRLP